MVDYYDENEQYEEDEEYGAYSKDDDVKSEMEEDGVYGDISDEELKRLMDARKERYMEGYNRPVKNSKTISSKTMIVVIVILVVYYLTAFVLNMAGVINNLTMFLIMAPVALASVIAYLVYRSKNSE